MKILITGGAGFIGSNLCEHFLDKGYQVVCMDNLSTGKEENMADFLSHPNFTFLQYDIRDLGACKKAVYNCDYVLHQAALGSVPRSINDPITTNEVNVGGFLNMLTAARDAGVKRFVYAASSSTYGDSKMLPKVEDKIGTPQSPYAITKYVNELYAQIFSKLYNIETIGLRYFNVFGKRQDPYGPYAAVIPLWVKAFINKERPQINGDGSFSRDFTYVANVIEANEKALFTSTADIRDRATTYNLTLPEKEAISMVFNVAFGGNTTLNTLFHILRDNLSQYDSAIASVTPNYKEERLGDIPHSQASIVKAKRILGYNPQYSAQQGFALACKWYYNNL